MLWSRPQKVITKVIFLNNRAGSLRYMAADSMPRDVNGENQNSDKVDDQDETLLRSARFFEERIFRHESLGITNTSCLKRQLGRTEPSSFENKIKKCNCCIGRGKTKLLLYAESAPKY